MDKLRRDVKQEGQHIFSQLVMNEFIPLLKTWLIRRGGLEAPGKPKLHFSNDHTVDLSLREFGDPPLYLIMEVHTDAPAKLKDYASAMSELVKQQLLKPLGFGLEASVYTFANDNGLLDPVVDWEFDPLVKDFVKDFVLDFAERLQWFFKKERIITSTDEEGGFVFEVLRKKSNSWKPQYTENGNLPPSTVKGLKKIHRKHQGEHGSKDQISHQGENGSNEQMSHQGENASTAQTSVQHSNAQTSGTNSPASFFHSTAGIAVLITVPIVVLGLLGFCYRQWKSRQESDSEDEESDDEYENSYDTAEKEKQESHQRQIAEIDRMARESSSREGSRANSSREGSERNHRSRN